MSAMVVMATALHEASLSQNELGQLGELPRVVNVTADGGSHTEKPPAPVIQVQNQALAMATGVDDCEIMVCHIKTMGWPVKPLMVAKCTNSDGFRVEDHRRYWTNPMQILPTP